MKRTERTRVQGCSFDACERLVHEAIEELGADLQALVAVEQQSAKDIAEAHRCPKGGYLSYVPSMEAMFCACSPTKAPRRSRKLDLGKTMGGYALKATFNGRAGHGVHVIPTADGSILALWRDEVAFVETADVANAAPEVALLVAYDLSAVGGLAEYDDECEEGFARACCSRGRVDLVDARDALSKLSARRGDQEGGTRSSRQ